MKNLTLLTLIFSISSRGALPVANPEDANWPQFRGPHAAGLSMNASHPDKWSAAENVAWKADLPGRSWSSPIVWDGRVFLTAVENLGTSEAPKKGLYFGGERPEPPKAEHRWKLLCLDLETGKMKWEKTVHEGPPQTPIHLKSSYGAETPVTDGERVYALFGNLGVFAFSLGGEEVWSRRIEPRKMRFGWGAAASPLLHGGKLFLVNDNEDKSELLALDAKTGKELWHEDRDEKSNWATPFLWQNGQRTELVTSGSRAIRSYDLDGKQLWSLRGMSSIAIPTPVAGDGLLFASSGYVGDKIRPVYAIRPGASGDITLKPGETNNEFVAWSNSTGGPYNPSPLFYEGRFYVLYDRGLLSCYDAKTGKLIYDRERLPDGFAFTSSPWGAGGRIFCLNEDGACYVIRAGDKFELLHINKLAGDDMCMATPAIAGNRLLIRTAARLYCIRPGESAGGIPYPDALRDAQVRLASMASGQQESLILGNGDLYGIVWEKQGNLYLRITKNDIWDARVDTSKDGPLPKVNVRTREVTGSTGAPPSYNNPFPQPRCAVAIRIGTAKAAANVSGLQATLDLRRAVADITRQNGEKTEVRILADRNVLLINTADTINLEEITASTLPRAQTGSTDGVEWLHMTLPGDTDYQGMEYCAAVGGTGPVKVVSIVTSFDIASRDVRGAALALVKKTLADAAVPGDKLVTQHELAWLDYWTRSGINLADRDLQNWWYRMMYFARTLCKSGTAPVALMPPLATDDTPWHGDYHFNYNSWQPFWSVISPNHPELADPWISYVHDLLPRAQWLAKETFDCDGVYYSISQFLHEPDPAVCTSKNRRQLTMNPWGMTIGMVGMTAQNLWHKHLCDPDRAYLEAKIYPTLREAARFYLSFMQQCGRDAAGKIRLGPSYSPEHGAMGIDNCPFDIAYVHYTFKAFEKASRELGKDRDLASQCLAMEELLADYPTALDANGQPVVVDWMGCKYKEVDMHNLTVPASPVFPAEQVTWFSPEPVKELFRRTIRDTQHNGNNSHVIFNIAKARLSMLDAVTESKTWFKSRELPNGLFLWQGHMHGTFMPESIGVAALVTEFLMQSVNDIIRVFPCWPGGQNASFKDLRAQGGFLVSADYVNGGVEQVSIGATVGGTLRLLSPWKTVLVNGNEMALDSNGVVNIPTKAKDMFTFKSGKP